MARIYLASLDHPLPRYCASVLAGEQWEQAGEEEAHEEEAHEADGAQAKPPTTSRTSSAEGMTPVPPPARAVQPV